MFKPCPACGFLVALLSGRAASQRCPRCGGAMLEEGEAIPGEDTTEARPLRTPMRGPTGEASGVAAPEGSSIPGEARGSSAAAPIADMELPEAPAAAEIADAEPPAAESGSPPVAAASPHAPAFARPTVRMRRPGPRWPYLLAIVALAMLLGVQLLLAQRMELAQQPRWRPWLVQACEMLGCHVPPWREPSAFAMLARNVHPDAARAGVLQVSTSVRNDAAWPQPLPVVVLRLSDVDGRTLAARAVPPAEYGRRADTLVAPGESVDIAFSVREPSPRVVSFDFQLR